MKRLEPLAYTRVRMKAAVNRVLPLILSLLVILTGQGVAASRGMDNAVGQMVLCTGSGPVVVYMDENGQPTSPPHYCPDYALSLLGAVMVPSVVLPEVSQQRLPSPQRQTGSLIALPKPRRPARAPPVPV
ncbi:hypothetical protein [uncultured Ruegeria sp.]|uniref:hypothetical protein n=1 Tax=uncultured Ruegeria sp. TaxID=259304 RepID=UPI0026284B88|nr:hypothetical protein [uncultured Ruegeria sp.]